jgi:hypothetical protein
MPIASTAQLQDRQEPETLSPRQIFRLVPRQRLCGRISCLLKGEVLAHLLR